MLYNEKITNIIWPWKLLRLKKSQNCRQHISSQTSVPVNVDACGYNHEALWIVSSSYLRQKTLELSLLVMFFITFRLEPARIVQTLLNYKLFILLVFFSLNI